jgi:hypothetical protein
MFLDPSTLPLPTRLALIDQHCTFGELLVEDTLRAARWRSGHKATVYCPFHDNTVTPAARLYPATQQYPRESLYCYSENRVYYPHHCCADYAGLITATSLQLCCTLWERLSATERLQWSTTDLDRITRAVDALQPLILNEAALEPTAVLAAYRAGTVPLSTVLAALYQC